MKTEELKDELNERQDLRKYLFIRGFLLTDDTAFSGSDFPFYGVWNKTVLSGFSFWTHELTGFHYAEIDENLFFLFGHAYNPFTMESDEKKILGRI